MTDMPKDVQLTLEDWESIAKHGGPYLIAALVFLYHAGICLPKSIVEEEVWRLHGDLTNLVAAMGRLAPILSASQKANLLKIATNIID